MSAEKPAPKTLLEAVTYFSDPDVALDFVAKIRWPHGPACPSEKCDSTKTYFLKTRKLWKCRACKKQFSVKVGTVFEDSPIPLSKWLPALWLIANCKNGISSYELSRALAVTQKTAWFMLHRLRLAMQSKTFERLGGVVEIDESWIGGRARFMHRGRRARVLQGRGSGMTGKVAVLGLLQRPQKWGDPVSKVRVRVVPNVQRRSMKPWILENVRSMASVYTDALRSYHDLDMHYVHKVVDHAERYVDGQVHTNGLENFWSLFKRSVRGTYVSIEPFHLFRYLDEQTYRFNNRKMTDGERFQVALAGVTGRRLTYSELIGEQEVAT
jgi:transposase-like protein